MKLREHRGSLVDSMATVIEIEPTQAALDAHIAKTLAPFGFVPKKPAVLDRFTYDERIGWNSYLVFIEGYGVFGFTDGPLKEET